jgi:hypothetical protein
LKEKNPKFDGNNLDLEIHTNIKNVVGAPRVINK